MVFFQQDQYVVLRKAQNFWHGAVRHHLPLLCTGLPLMASACNGVDIKGIAQYLNLMYCRIMLLSFFETEYSGKLPVNGVLSGIGEQNVGS